MKNSEDKSKTLIKLGIYMLFLFFVIGLIITSGAKPIGYYDNTNTESKSENEKTTTKTYLQKEKELISGTYEYKFIIDNGEIIFEGFARDGLREGTKTVGEVEIDYQEGEVVSIIENGLEKEYVDLYEGLDESLFDFESLFEKLNAENCVIDRREEEIVYSYTNILGYDLDITTDRDNIIKIDINGSHKYSMEFTY